MVQDFMEARKKRLAGDIVRQANTGEITETLNMALKASDCDQANIVHNQRLLSDNGPISVIASIVL